MTQRVLDMPPHIRAALERLQADLAQAAGKNLAGLILYGGLARGRYRPGQSDVNVVVLLHDATAPALAAIAPALTAARRAVAVDPLLLTPEEVIRAADAFPTKFLDIQRHRVVLMGVDPFADLEVSRAHLRLRIEQELRNLLLRLRRRYVAVAGHDALLTQTLTELARPFALELEALLYLAGKPVPAEDRSAAIFEAASDAFDLPREPLARLAELRQSGQPSEDAPALCQGVLDALTRAVAVADQMEDPQP